MRSYRVLVALLLSIVASPAVAAPVDSNAIGLDISNFSPAPRSPLEKRDFTNKVVFTPPSTYTSWKTIYGRSAQVTDGSLLVTWEDYPLVDQTPFPIYRSTDGGVTWASYSQILDQVNGWGMRYQPHFYVLPTAFGGYAAGTVLCAGVSAPSDLSEAYIDLYASTNNGLTWKFVSHIAYGSGPELASNGDAAIWEPFFLMYGSTLICYYSDQRDPAHGQKLAYQTTTNLVSWGGAVDVVADPTYSHRPGMAIVSYLASINLYFLTFENCTSSCLTTYRWSSSPYTFNSAPSTLLAPTSGSNPGNAPFHIYYNGKIYLNAAQSSSIYVNTAGTTTWTPVAVAQIASYTRCLEIIKVGGVDKLLITSAGEMSSSANNYVSVGVITPP
ncbi:hypothetical protein BP5796_12252 [Coleophoma crateriformis]|uniref:Glycoside hydrolase family 93 protein n=1 Tax=Coleophoma crateriformis TaxID=565419 RepID=A0A3D8Q911_9HELO|nr:hypothetical protein BP5796_12252 [Coleophoma crateriformis]